ncbi:hypothetical protein Tsubulata_003732 [Turnera subulata]|uniref:Uncharacterized protein n=1 Tax=Turnera subulata TaxID=218843 RepID=A0A9Q0GES5_9ROSI|nr:hypothetical protein Tsubulata_003732 [Turnera subulata]
MLPAANDTGREIQLKLDEEMNNYQQENTIAGSCLGDHDDQDHELFAGFLPQRFTRMGNSGVRRGAWTEEEDKLLRKCVEQFGEGKWHLVPSRAGRVYTYMFFNCMCRWSLIAGRLPGRTANDVKNYWNTNMRKNKAVNMTIACKGNPLTKKPETVVIKPRPWAFRKALGWQSYNGETSIPNHNAHQFLSNNIHPSKEIILPPADISGRQNSLLLEDEQIIHHQQNTIAGVCLGDHDDQDHELFAGFLPQINDPAGIRCFPEDIFLQESPSCWRDFSVDDLWNLFSTELEAPATPQNRSN